MSKRVAVPTNVVLEYWQGRDLPGVVYENTPVDPEHTDELTIALRSDEPDDTSDPRTPLFLGRPQVHFAGTPRALEAFGRYLIALARLETADPNPHEHFEDVQNADGGTIHLIVRRE
ncbi:MAG: hypothetical protein IRY91_05675 [Gemmatimonadaceae bacterium]|nr:hypothetical protein [Gemmatimonadaceae bacterium]